MCGRQKREKREGMIVPKSGQGDVGLGDGGIRVGTGTIGSSWFEDCLGQQE